MRRGEERGQELVQTARNVFSNAPLLVFMLGHFSVDMYSGILPVLYPLMSDEFDLSNASVGLIALAYTTAASLSQPFFGYLSDRYGSRYFIAASIVWSSVTVGLIGWAPSYLTLLGLALLAGLGSGAYHPQGASNASAAAGDVQRNSALAFYTVAGTSGYSLGPIIGALMFLIMGREGTILMLPFGCMVAIAIFRQMTRLGLGQATMSAARQTAQTAIQWTPLLLVMSIVMLRSWVFSSAVAFVPLWFDDLGYSSGFYSVLTTAILATGAAGTLLGGILADRHGQRRILFISLFGCVPMLLLFAAFPGWQSLLFGPLFAFLADMSIAVTLVMAQRVLPGRIGMASGFILGMGFVTGGIGVPITGLLADRYGNGEALMISSVLIVAAGILVAFIPRRAIAPVKALTPEPEPAS
jgi:FSR family fosmidomycin resistance protein-like MFS transporter